MAPREGTEAVTVAGAPPPSAVRVASAITLRRLVRQRGAAVGLAVLGLLAAMALAAPWLSPRDPIRTAPREALQPPGSAFVLGSDQLGRDVASRVLHGARISLLAIVTVLSPGLNNVMIAVGLSAVPSYARLVRASVLSAREHLYVEAARAIGGRDLSILARYIVPNVVAPLIVTATLGLGTAILSAASLSFLGLGSQPPQPEWGRMLSEGRDYLREAWWISTCPGVGIMLTVLAMNLLGDGLRDVLDPRLKT